MTQSRTASSIAAATASRPFHALASSMPPTDIPNLKPAQRVQDAFLVMDVELRTLETGEAFTILRLGNSTGEIATEPFWPTRQDEVAGVKKGHPVQVVGEVGVYR